MIADDLILCIQQLLTLKDKDVGDRIELDLNKVTP